MNKTRNQNRNKRNVSFYDAKTYQPEDMLKTLE